jgi:hypothetical protein
MSEKPTSASGYTPELTDLTRATCLYVATRLGDLMDDFVIVGGLAPSLLIDQAALPAGAEMHVGTRDLDLGMSLAIFDEEHYRAITERLRAAGFVPDVNTAGNQTRHRWVIRGSSRLEVDFLIPPSREGDRGGRIRNIEPDFAALITPGLDLAFLDRVRITLEQKTILGEAARREVWVCGPGAYVVLKALAFRGRGDNKDAYDLAYVIRNYGSGVEDVAERLRPLLTDENATRAVEILREDFIEPSALGPMRVAQFIANNPDDEIQADVAGFTRRLLVALE